MTKASANFSFLGRYDAIFVTLASEAERAFAGDPATTLAKLRLFGEALAKHVAAAYGVYHGPPVTQLDLLKTLEARGFLDRAPSQLFHQLRRRGNEAVHENKGDHREALEQLKLARELAIWFHRTFGGGQAATFKPGPFVPPEDPSARLRALEAEVTRLKDESEKKTLEAEAARQLAEAEKQRAEEADAAKKKAEDERAAWEEFASQHEASTKQKLKDFEEVVAALQAEGAKKSEKELASQVEFSNAAAAEISLTEAQARILIDGQLCDAGWEANTETLRYGKGTRPAKGKKLAIAEWPTSEGPADYVLFDGLTPLGVVEAKRENKSAYGAIDQAQRYSKALSADAAFNFAKPLGGGTGFNGWSSSTVDSAKPPYKVPFLYSTNSKPYHRQAAEQTGVWFLDARLPTNHPRALDGFHSPATLRAKLESDPTTAQKKLAAESVQLLGLKRDYQESAIEKIEAALFAGKREVLVEMATGTGKTRTLIGLLHRLLQSGQSARVLFLVDRNALGTQAFEAMSSTKFSDVSFAKTYMVGATPKIEDNSHGSDASDVQVYVATVQGIASALLRSDNPPPIDLFDLIVVDEAHRGYTLDKAMTDDELALDDIGDYISVYRRVLDHFDAAKIALTATPALHTQEIFGKAVFSYGYQQAVVEGWLIDHELPVVITTKLAKDGIHFDANSQVAIITGEGETETLVLKDDVDIEIDGFNKNVVTEGFNRAVLGLLAEKSLDRESLEKTLIFCVDDDHANLVVRVLKEELERVGGPIDDGFVKKITGKTDQVSEAIRSYKHELHPSIAVTVDLLTTGIDVPRISNLVFLRRVRSRILYEQMIGRATRLCDEIGKETFRIFDAVDLYSALEPVTQIRPLVRSVSFEAKELLDRLKAAAAANAPPADSQLTGKTHAQGVFDQFIERIRRGVRSAALRKDDQPWQSAASTLTELLGCAELKDVPAAIKKLGIEGLIAFLKAHPEVEGLIERFAIPAPARGRLVYAGADEILSVENGFPAGKKPEDYLLELKAFIDQNKNTVPALKIVLTRPRDLTRAQLNELRVLLENHGFSEREIQRRWKQWKNEDIAASIVGFIRQQALGSPLVPYAERVDRAAKRILASRAWTTGQQRWLSYIVAQMKVEIVVDPDAFDRGAFVNDGGLRAAERAFDGNLREVLNTLSDEVWRDAA